MAEYYTTCWNGGHYPILSPTLMVEMKSKRLTRENTAILEEHFRREHKPSSNIKRQIAASMGVAVEKINNWFQNRRAKEKTDQRKEVQKQYQNSLQDGTNAPTYSSGDDTDNSPVPCSMPSTTHAITSPAAADAKIQVPHGNLPTVTTDLSNHNDSLVAQIPHNDQLFTTSPNPNFDLNALLDFQLPANVYDDAFSTMCDQFQGQNFPVGMPAVPTGPSPMQSTACPSLEHVETPSPEIDILSALTTAWTNDNIMAPVQATIQEPVGNSKPTGGLHVQPLWPNPYAAGNQFSVSVPDLKIDVSAVKSEFQNPANRITPYSEDRTVRSVSATALSESASPADSYSPSVSSPNTQQGSQVNLASRRRKRGPKAINVTRGTQRVTKPGLMSGQPSPALPHGLSQWQAQLEHDLPTPITPGPPSAATVFSAPPSSSGLTTCFSALNTNYYTASPPVTPLVPEASGLNMHLSNPWQFTKMTPPQSAPATQLSFPPSMVTEYPPPPNLQHIPYRHDRRPSLPNAGDSELQPPLMFPPGQLDQHAAF